MFCKLALGNVRRSFRDYGVYLLTLTFGVCLFYTFNSLEGQPVMGLLQSTRHSMVESIFMLLQVFSVFVAVVLACLVVYGNSFLLRRRKRELGLYLLLGLSQGQVALVLALETGLAALVSLAAGLGLGVLASQGLSALTLSMFQVDLPSLAVAVSPAAMGRTAAYFLGVFVLVAALSALQVSRARLLELMNSPRKNETAPREPLWASLMLLLAGVGLVGSAYYLVLTNGILNVNSLFWAMLALGSLGTFCLFRALSALGLRLMDALPGVKLRGLNLFTLGQWFSRGRTHCLSQTVICLMLLLAIGITASAVGLNNTITAQSAMPVDFVLTVWDHQREGPQTDPPARTLEEAGYSLGEELSHALSCALYYNDPAVTGVGEAWCPAMTERDYRAALAFWGLEGDLPPLPAQVEMPQVMMDTLTTGWDRVVVMPEDMAGGLERDRLILAGDYAGDRQQGDAALTAALEESSHRLGSSFWLRSALEEYLDTLGTKVLVLFLGLYLGVTFLLSSAAVLALQQLSQGADNTPRYAVLGKLGAPEGMVGRSAAAQVALAFVLPLALAAVHAAVGLRAVEDVLGQVQSVNAPAAAAASATSAVLLGVVYGGYFLATALTCRALARGAATRGAART